MSGYRGSGGFSRRHDPDDGLLSSAEVCALAECGYRQLDHWLRTGALHIPHLAGGGPGHHRRFTPLEADLAVAVAAEKHAIDVRFEHWSSGEFCRDLIVVRAMAEGMASS